MKNYKIRISSPEESKAVQEHAFKMGYGWGHNGNRNIHSYPVIYATREDKKMWQDEGDSIYTEITPADFLKLYTGARMPNQQQVQWRFKTREEFEKEYGPEWRKKVYSTGVDDMDDLHGKSVGGKTIGEATVHANKMTRWAVSDDMLTSAPLPEKKQSSGITITIPEEIKQQGCTIKITGSLSGARYKIPKPRKHRRPSQVVKENKLI